MIRFSVLGIDVSSRAVDLVTLDENANQAEHDRLQLDGDTAFDRCRKVADVMPQPGWYEERGIYLIGIERPFHRRGQDVVRLFEGAILVTLPTDVPVWEVRPSEWKGPLGVKLTAKPEWDHFGLYARGFSQDALDALGVALYVREKNRAGIVRRIA